MGKNKRGGGGRGRGRGGRGGGDRGGGRRTQDRTDYSEIEKENEKFKSYYKEQNIITDEEEFEQFWQSLKETLPTTWRFTGSKGHAKTVLQTLLSHHIPALTNITFEGRQIPAPTPLPWYPDQLAWQLTVGKQVIRRSPPFKHLQAFLVSETNSGNISRQEAVSMIPPLLLDVEPHHSVLDMCAAPGSKTAQLIEAIHAGEEDRVAVAAEKLLTTPVASGSNEFPEAPLGRATGVVIANDADYKRSHLLIHQTKRLNTPNFIVTNQDATIYPSLRLPTKVEPGTAASKTKQEYLKFDRVLCDVPCSGDGTIRKNILVWKDWSAANGNGLWSTQCRILVRGLQLLKVGGRLVYSTCSLNPIENESVIAAAIERCGGKDVVEVVDVSDRLTDLKRKAGLKTWKVMDRDGTWFGSWEEVKERGAPYSDRLTRGMFPPAEGDVKAMLDRCVRVYPHLQDTGGFFIVVLKKKGLVKAAPEEQKVVSGGQKMKGVVKTSEKQEENGETTIEVADVETATSTANGNKRSLSDDDEADVNVEEAPAPASPTKRQRLDVPLDTDTSMSTLPPSIDATTDAAESAEVAEPEAEEDAPIAPTHSKKPRQPTEEPFTYLPANHETLLAIQKFYHLSPHFPLSTFLVRNAEGIPVRTIYYTSTLTSQILTENASRGVKFVHAGVKMFNKQDVQDPEACPWRIQMEGLGILEAWVGKEREVRLTKRGTLRYLMKELFPRLEDIEELEGRLREVTGGCCVLRVGLVEDEKEEKESEAEGAFEGGEVGDLVLPLWKSRFTVNLMLPKEERRAMLLRLFNDNQGPVDSTKEQREADARARKEADAAAESGLAADDAEQDADEVMDDDVEKDD